METLTFRQPRLVALIILVLVSAGLSSFLSLGRQEDPTITNIFANVTTQFPGADPARVEALVTTEIEDELRKIAEIDTISSVSRSGVSVVSIELLETLDETTIQQVWVEARDAVENARRSFPPGVLPPEFDSEGISAYSAVIGVTADHDGVPLTLLARHAEGLADRLRSLPQARAVNLFGVPEEEVLIDVDPDTAAALGLTAREIAGRIGAADGKVQAGRLQGDSDLTLAVSGEIEDLTRLRDVVLRENADGTVVTLADVATITRGPREPASELALANGRPAVLVAALAQDGVQIDGWMETLRAELAEGADLVPLGMSETLLFDQSGYTLDRLGDVGLNMAMGVFLVVVVLLVTLGLRAAMIVAFVLPIVSLATLGSMNMIGLPLHQMSVTGLIVALGLLVDAAIVMTDEVRRRLTDGMARKDAVADAVRRLAAPLTASTVTTALSFTPMILLPGPAGDFVSAIAIAVVLMLFWSLVIALTVTPALAGWFLPTGPAGNGLRMPALGRVFEASLRWSIGHPVKSVALSLVLPVMGFLALPSLTAQFFPGVERNQFHIEIDMPPGTAIGGTMDVVAGIDGTLRGDADVDSVYWSVGRSAPAFYYNLIGNRSREPGYAQAMVTTTSDAGAERLVAALQSQLDAAYPEAQIIVRGLVQGPPVDAPVELRIVGQDIATLRDLGDELRATLAGVETITQVRAGVNGGAPQVRFEIDEVKARLLGFDIADIAGQLDSALVGVTGGTLVEGTEQLPVRVRLGGGLRGDIQAISDLPVLLPAAAAISATGVFPAVPLSEIADPADRACGKRHHPSQRRARKHRPGLSRAGCSAGRGSIRCARDPRRRGLHPSGRLPAGHRRRCRRAVEHAWQPPRLARADRHPDHRDRGPDLQQLPHGRREHGRRRPVCGPVHPLPRHDAVPSGHCRDHRGHRLDRGIDQCGDHHPERPAGGPARQGRRPCGDRGGGERLVPAHRLDDGHDIRGLPAAHPRWRRLLAALRRGDRRRRAPLDGGVLLLHAADVRPRPAPWRDGRGTARRCQRGDAVPSPGRRVTQGPLEPLSVNRRRVVSLTDRTR